MHRHQWVLLLTVYVLLLLLGAAAFFFLERGQEADRVRRVLQLRADIQEELFAGENATTVRRRSSLLERVSDECVVDVTNTSTPPATVWNEYNSFFFCFTVVTTIGYGHIAPKTTLGRAACIVYALIGIPLNGILLKSISDLLSNKVIQATQRIKERRHQTKLEVSVDTLFYLIPALLVFLVIPAGIFMLIEDWTFFQAVYYTFITLTTIGFGDEIAGKVVGPDYFSGWLWLYKISLVVWILCGLGYLLMILDFISKALYQKKMSKLERRVAKAISKTKQKLRKNISKEVHQIRRALYELALKRHLTSNLSSEDLEHPAPLYRTHSFSALNTPPAPTQQLPRCSSQPSLTGPPTPATDAVDNDALEVLLQATLTLEWDLGSDGRSLACGAADGGVETEAGEAVASRRGSVWKQLGSAWRQRPSLLPAMSSRRRESRQPSLQHDRRVTTTNLADVLHVLRLDARPRTFCRPAPATSQRRATVAAPLSPGDVAEVPLPPRLSLGPCSRVRPPNSRPPRARVSFQQQDQLSHL